MSDQGEKPKQDIDVYQGGGFYSVKSLLAISKSRSKHLRRLFDQGELPWRMPMWLENAEDVDETITDKQRRKLLKRYGHEWNVYLERYTKPAEFETEYIGYYRRN